MCRNALLEQSKRLVPPSVFQRHFSQSKVHLVQVRFVFVVLEHGFQKLHNGFAVAVAALVSHGLLNVALEHPLVICPTHAGNLLKLLDGALFVFRLSETLGQHKGRAGPCFVLFAHAWEGVFEVSCRSFVIAIEDFVLGQNHQGVDHRFV